MGDRCLSALESLGGEATSDEVRAYVEAGWQRPLTTAQVSIALAGLSRLDPPRVTQHPAPEGGRVWRTVEAEAWADPVKPWEAGVPPFTVADAGETAGKLEAAVDGALREAS